MTAPAAKKGRTVLISSDPCPRGCNAGPNKATHLMSDHAEEKARQCNLCSCVVQDIAEIKPGT